MRRRLPRNSLGKRDPGHIHDPSEDELTDGARGGRRRTGKVIVTGSFDALHSRHVRFLEKSSRLGQLHVALWTDPVVRAMEGKSPRFPFAERAYILQAVRYVHRIVPAEAPYPADSLPDTAEFTPDVWVVDVADSSPRKEAFCRVRGLMYRVLDPPDIRTSRRPPLPVGRQAKDAKRVLVTGSFDWFHSGHVRFLEEASAYGDLYVGVGSDANLRLLKGKGHPLFPERERLYLVHSIRYVKRAFLATGRGWLDAEPEISILKPLIYIVNEDGDRPEKREFCRRAGIEYLVLKRTPKTGLPRRDSTSLRGF